VYGCCASSVHGPLVVAASQRYIVALLWVSLTVRLKNRSTPHPALGGPWVSLLSCGVFVYVVVLNVFDWLVR